MTRQNIIKNAQWTQQCENETDFQVICHGKARETEFKDGWQGLMYRGKDISFVYFYGENTMYAL